MLPTFARIALGVSLAAALGAAACTRAAQPDTEAGVEPQLGPAVLVFRNQSLEMATVYAIQPGGEAYRVGNVTAGRTETLRLPASIARAGSVTIVAVPLAGSRAASTGPITLGPGVRLEITLPSSQNILTVLPAGSP